MKPAATTVLLVGSALLTQRYAVALHSLGLTSHSLSDEATWAGHAALAQELTA